MGDVLLLLDEDVLADSYGRSNRHHCGLVIAQQERGSYRRQLRDLGRLLIERTPADLRDAVLWLPI